MSENTKAHDALEQGVVMPLAQKIGYQDGGIVSRTLYRAACGTLTLFAFDAGQSLSEHTAPFDAFVQVLEGECVVKVGGQEVNAKAGDMVFMPAGVPHAVAAQTRFKMLLSMFRSQAPS